MQEAQNEAGRGRLSLSVLVIEDEPLISMLIEDMLEQSGCSIVGPCASVAEAMNEIAGCKFDVALVDLGLSDGTSEPVMRELDARSIPFAIMSGQARPGTDDLAAAHLPKPFTYADVTRTLETLANSRAEPSTG